MYKKLKMVFAENYFKKINKAGDYQENIQKKNKPKIIFISTEGSVYCFGLRILSSVVKKYGYESIMVFMPTIYESYSKKEIKQLIKICEGALAICISSMAINFKRAIQVANSLKQVNIPLIMGGIHATLNPEECLKYVDFVCIGEGDDVIVQLLEKIQKKETVFQIKNICYKKDGKIISNKVRNLISNIDNLPFPDYNPDNKIVSFNRKLVPFDEEHLSYGPYNFFNSFFAPFNSVMTYHTIRGCSHSCKYCCNYDLKILYRKKGLYVRALSVKNLIQGLKYLIKTYPHLDFIWFTDDDFFIRDLNGLKKFSKEYKKSINLPFMCYLTPKKIDEEKLKLLLSAGLKRVEVGLQTGDDNINKEIYSRNIVVKDIMSVALLLDKYKIYMYSPEYQIINTNFLEKENNIIQTIKLIQNLPKPFTLKILNLIFFPGSIFEKEQIIDKGKEITENFSDVNYLDHFKHLKKRDLKCKYFFTILSLMSGYCNDQKYGSLTKNFLAFLLNKKVIWLNNKTSILTYILRYLYINKNHFYWMLPSPKLKQIYFKRKIVKYRNRKYVKSIGVKDYPYMAPKNKKTKL